MHHPKIVGILCQQNLSNIEEEKKTQQNPTKPDQNSPSQKKTHKNPPTFAFPYQIVYSYQNFFAFHKKHIKRRAHCHCAVAILTLMRLSIFSKSCFFEVSYSKLFREFTIQ